MSDVITIGSITQDKFLELDYQIINWPKTALRKAIALPFGEKIEVSRLTTALGGNSANASVTFARQGWETACFGKVGNDIAGKEVRSLLREEGVKSFLAVSQDLPTAYSALLLKDGERTILSYHGASDNWQGSDIPWDKLKSRWWYLSLAGESDKFLESLLVFARKNNIQVAFNPSGHHIKHRRREILAALKDISFLVLNRGEAAALSGMPFQKEKEIFQKLDELTPGIVAITDGPKGVIVSDGEYICRAGIFKERKLIDRTGAGDAFGSGFVAGLIQASAKDKHLSAKRYSLNAVKYAIRLASANATSVVEHIGATEGILTKSQFQSLRWKNFPIKVTRI